MRKTKGGNPVRILAGAALELVTLVAGRSVDPSALSACFELEVSSFEERLEDTVAFFAMVRRKALTQIAFNRTWMLQRLCRSHEKYVPTCIIALEECAFIGGFTLLGTA